MRTVGTVTRGIICPVISPGDDLQKIIVDSVVAAAQAQGVSFKDRDIIGVTEAVVAKAQGNYATVNHIAQDIEAKFKGEVLGVIFPILSRNRFSVLLKGIAQGKGKIVLMLSYPSDEVGNPLITQDMLDTSGVNPWSDTLSISQYREKFGSPLHPFTGVDYISYYTQLINEQNCEVEIIFSNNPLTILNYADNVLACDIHTRDRTVEMLKKSGAKTVLSLGDILNASVNGSGYNDKYGLLGSNKATEEKVKLFPRDGQVFVDKLQATLLEKTGKNIEVLIYGDGAFKDPAAKIWELADPVVSPAFTAGLAGTPNEVKFKYIADNQLSHLKGQELNEAIKAHIKNKDDNLMGKMVAQGTTPRQLSDLIGSLCDLTSGSGDKGTPLVWIQGYFDNYSS